MRFGSWLSLSAACVALAAPAHAQQYTDGSFSGWTSSLYAGSACPNLVVTNPATGGNPGAKLAFTQSACSTPEFATHYSPFTWNPLTQGAVSSITVGWDARWTGGSFQGDTRIGTGFIMRQGSHLFLGLPAIANFGEVSTNSWVHFAATLTAATWCDYAVFFCTGAQPDYSTAGGLMEFGLETSNYCPSCSKTLSGELDNFSVDIAYTPPTTVAPEPASVALMATGLVGLAAVVRRRRAS